MFSTSLPVTTVTPTSGQSTLKSTGQSATGEGVKVTMSGDNNSLTVRQAGNNNFIVGTNWSDNAQVSGDNNTLSFNQGNILTSGSSGNNGLAFGIDTFGKSAPYKEIYKHFGLTASNIANKSKKMLRIKK